MYYIPRVPKDSLRYQMYRLLPIIDVLHLRIVGRSAIITSTTNGKHRPGSLHYIGLAVDLRTTDLSIDEINELFNELQSALTYFCDLELKSNHIHIEFNPKV